MTDALSENLSSPTLDDQKWIMELSAASNLHSADFSFGSIYCWNDSTNAQVARVGDRLFMRYRMDAGISYAYPVGFGDMRPILDAIYKDAKSLGVPLVIRGIPENTLPEISGFYDAVPKLTMNKAFSDYVYSAVSLATLSGKKLHGKKNHLNRFMAEHDWSFEPIGETNIQECHEMCAQWFVNAAQERHVGYTREIRALYRTFQDFFALGFDGGIIRDGGHVVAVTIGELISPDTFVTHFEKADPHINGGYTIINQQFAQFLVGKYSQLVYINREEDMGLENLRKAKLSYQPEFMVDKYTAEWIV